MFNLDLAKRTPARGPLANILKRHLLRQLLFIWTAFLALRVLSSCGQTNPSASTITRSRTSKKDSLTIDSLVHLATISDSLNDLPKSIKYYSEILDIDSIKLIALINRGRALIALGQIQKGFADYNKAVKHYPNEETYFTRGMAYAMTNDYKSAFPDFAAAATINPKFGKAYYGYSLVKINGNQFNYALYWCNKADSLSYIPGLSKNIRNEIEKGLKSK
jgi:tetratricopeptide (TPR) repeat protein